MSKTDWMKTAGKQRFRGTKASLYTRCFRSSEPLLSCYLHPISLTPFYGWLYVRMSPVPMATFNPLGKIVQMLCHSTTNRLEASPLSLVASYSFSVKMVRCAVTAWLIILEVLDHTGIEFTILLRLSLRPALASLEFVTVIQSQSPTRNTTDKV